MTITQNVSQWLLQQFKKMNIDTELKMEIVKM